MIITRITASVLELTLRSGAEVLFVIRTPKHYDEAAALSGDVVYFKATSTPAIQRAVNAWHPEAPHCRVSDAEFRFVLGSALTTTGLPLTRLREDTNDAST